MKRKRKAEDDDHPGHSLDASGKKREDCSAASGPSAIPIDLTLSEGEDDDQQHVQVKVKNTVILSDSEGDQDRDEVLFLKEASSSKSSAVQAEASSNTKTINDILRDNSRPSSHTVPKSLPPLLLSTPAQVAKHTPCTLHYDILPSSLANRLYLKMIDESTSWKKNKWYLNDRLVESSHKTCFYTSSSHKRNDGKVDEQWYMGRKMEEEEDGKGRLFLEEMEEAREIIEEFVNERLKEKKRYAMEYDGLWKANVAASNCYRGGAETVGYHADQLTYLGPYPTIASLSLGTTRIFRLRGVASLQDETSSSGTSTTANTNINNSNNRTYDISLPHNSLCIMGAGCQEKYKHTIPPARSIDVFKVRNKNGEVEAHIERINITFRFYRPDFKPDTTPLCHCGIPSVLKADAKGKAAANLVNCNGNGEMDKKMRFFWMCFAGAQNEGKRCSFFKILDMEGEKRGPCIGDN